MLVLTPSNIRNKLPYFYALPQTAIFRNPAKLVLFPIQAELDIARVVGEKLEILCEKYSYILLMPVISSTSTENIKEILAILNELKWIINKNGYKLEEKISVIEQIQLKFALSHPELIKSTYVITDYNNLDELESALKHFDATHLP